MYVLNFMHFSSSERHVAHHNRVWKDVSETKRNMRYPGILSWKISYLKFLLMDEKLTMHYFLFVGFPHF